MYILVLIATLLSGLLLARRIAEPRCPSCAGKSWMGDSTRLQCARCGWSNVGVAAVAVEPRPIQYELGFQAE